MVSIALGDDYARDAAPEVSPGDVVHAPDVGISYRILRLIGEGRCSVVYGGETVHSGEPVAIKLFRPGPLYQTAAAREIAALARFAGRSTATNIVSCLSVTAFKGITCLILELLSWNIRQLIAKNNRRGLPLWTVVKFARDVLTCLDLIHQERLVHADLKPDNILWSSQEGCFKCLDFGLSFSVDQEDVHQIQSGGYRAPEVTIWNTFKESKKRVRRTLCIAPEEESGRDSAMGPGAPRALGGVPGSPADIWSFGCLLAEALFGRKLLRVGDRCTPGLRQLMEMQSATMLPEALEARDVAVRGQLLDLIASCLTEDPAARITAAAARQLLARTAAPLAQPSRADNLLLPSPILLFTINNKAAVDQQLALIRQLCTRHGRVVDSRLMTSSTTGSGEHQLLVQFLSAQEAARARILLTCPTSLPANRGDESATRERADKATSRSQRTYSDGKNGLCVDYETRSCGAGNETRSPEDERESRLCLAVSSREEQDMQRGFLTEFYPLELWYNLTAE